MYLSPLRLTGLTEPVTNKKGLLLGRKKLLAELELSGGLTIDVNGRELSRQDIIAFFDSLDNDEVLEFHTAIFNDPALMHFLEQSAITGISWNDKELYNTQQFRIFVSSFFSVAVNNLLRKILKGERPKDDYTTLITRPQFLLMQDAESAFTFATRFYYRRKAALEVLADRMETSVGGNYVNVFDPATMAPKLTFVANELVRPEEIIAWRDETNIPLLNRLPDDFFGELRYNIANELNNLCIISDTQNHSTSTGYEALLTAAGINCGMSLQEIIRGNLNIFKAKLSQPINRATGGVKKEKPGFTWSGVGIAIFIILRLLFGASACNEHESSFQNAPVTFYQDNTYRYFDRMGLYTAIYSGLTNAPGDIKDTISRIDVQLPKPQKAGSDPLTPLWQQLSIMPAQSSIIDSSQMYKLRLSNKSNWGVVAFYLIADTSLNAAYIPPHQNYTLLYDQHGKLKLNLLAGRNWNKTQERLLGEYISADSGYRYYRLKGWFGEVAHLKTNVLEADSYLLEDEPFAIRQHHLRILIQDSLKSVQYKVFNDVNAP